MILQPSAKMAERVLPKIPAVAISDRKGTENMDGHWILRRFEKVNARPWNHFIPIDELSKDNLPPFYVRLRDDQVGHLDNWIRTKKATISRAQVYSLWPWDFGRDSRITVLKNRDSWGPSYDYLDAEFVPKGLTGNASRKTPRYLQIPLPLTYTSSGKIMAPDAHKESLSSKSKRKAEDTAASSIPQKKLRLWKEDPPELTPIETIKRETGSIQISEEERGYRHLQNLIANSSASAKRISDLETRLTQQRETFQEAYDSLHDEWIQLVLAQAKEYITEREVLVNAAKQRKGRIKQLETNLTEIRQRLKVRGQRLKSVKQNWAEQFEALAQKAQELEEKAQETDRIGGEDWNDDETGSEGDESERDGEDDEEQEQEDVKKENDEDQEASDDDSDKDEDEKDSKGPEKVTAGFRKVISRHERRNSAIPKGLATSDDSKGDKDAEASTRRWKANDVRPKTENRTGDEDPAIYAGHTKLKSQDRQDMVDMEFIKAEDDSNGEIFGTSAAEKDNTRQTYTLKWHGDNRTDGDSEDDVDLVE